MYHEKASKNWECACSCIARTLKQVIFLSLNAAVNNFSNQLLKFVSKITTGKKLRACQHTECLRINNNVAIMCTHLLVDMSATVYVCETTPYICRIDYNACADFQFSSHIRNANVSNYQHKWKAKRKKRFKKNFFFKSWKEKLIIWNN